jgi:hypothetical protein
VRAYHCWFNDSNTKLPVWESPLQTGLEFSPLFSSWRDSDQGLDVSTLFSPGLASLLYKEGQALLQLGMVLEESENAGWLASTCEQLSAAVERSFDAKKKSYCYRDISSWRCDPDKDIKEFKRNGTFQIKRNFKVQRRLLVTCSAPHAKSKNVQIKLAGTCNGSPISEVFSMNFPYYQNSLTRYTSKNLFTTLESVEVSGLSKEAVINVKLAGTDFSDLSLFLPLWAGLVSPENAREIIENDLLPHYLTPFGLSCFPLDNSTAGESQPNSIVPLWNALMIESLIKYGYRAEAARVLTNLLEASIVEWKQTGHTNSSLRTTDGRGNGDHDSLDGLRPIWPLLKLLGIEYLDTKELNLRGLNDLFASFTVQYERVMLILQQNSTVIQTVTGSRTEIEQAGNYKILLP